VWHASAFIIHFGRWGRRVALISDGLIRCWSRVWAVSEPENPFKARSRLIF
jgi:hypothetical protein